MSARDRILGRVRGAVTGARTGGDRVAEVGQGLAVPEGATVIDLSRCSVLPGLIDAHTHLLLEQRGGEGLSDVAARDQAVQGDVYRALSATGRARDAAGNRSTRSATVRVTTDASGPTPGVGCSVGYKVVGQWPNGFQGEITIRNTGTTAINGWNLGFSFANGQTINNMWGGTPTQSGGTVSVTPASYTASIAAGSSVTVGFTAARGASNTAPTAFTLSGAACAKA